MSLIADSLKKIEKGENDTSAKEGGFSAPPLMQKDFGGGKGGKGGGGKSSRALLLVLVAVVVIVGGGGGFLYMSGAFDFFLKPEIIPMPRVQRNIPQEEDIIVGTTDETNVLENGTVTNEQIIDIVETESARDLNPAIADNITAGVISFIGDNESQYNVTKKVVAKDNKTAVTPTTNVTVKKPAVTKTKSNETAKGKKTTTSKSNKIVKKPTNNVRPAKNAKTQAKGAGSTTANKKPAVTSGLKAQKPVVKPKVPLKPVTINDKLTYTSLISLGESSAGKNDYESAIKYFREASEIDNSNILMGNIAALYIKQGKPALASEMVIVNKIKDAQIVSGLIIDMSSHKYFVQALVLLKYSAANIQPDSQTVYAEGYYYEMQRGYVKASEYYQRAFEMNSREPAYLYAYARCLDFSEQYYKALESYMKVVAMKPDDQIKILSEKRIRSLQGYLRKSE